MLLKFYKIISLKNKFFYTGFTGFSSRWKYRLGVSMGLSAHHLLVRVGVCQVGIRVGTYVIKHRSFLIHYFTLLATMHFQIYSTYILSVSKY